MRTEQIQIRVSKEEKELIYSLAKEKNETITNFLVGCALANRTITFTHIFTTRVSKVDENP